MHEIEKANTDSVTASASKDEHATVNWTNMILFTSTPLLAAILVPWYGMVYGYSLYDWVAFILMMGFCGISITAGYHRLWSHKAYKAHPVLRAIFCTRWCLCTAK